MKIQIRKKSQSQLLMSVLILMPFAMAFLTQLLPLPRAVYYLCDVAWIWLLALMCLNRKMRQKHLQGAWMLVGSFLAITAMVYAVCFQSPFFYLWGVRNNFRFYIAFLAFASFLDEREVRSWLKLFDGLFWINAAVAIFQFAFLDVSGDYLGGIFGAGTGANGYANIYLLIVLSKSVLFYLNGREKMWLCGLKIVVSLIISAMAEMKFFFLEVGLLLILAVLFTGFTWRKFWLLLSGVMALLLGTAVLAVVFPDSAEKLALGWFLEAATSEKGYTSAGDMNRLYAIPVIHERWLTHWSQRIFGLGLGNCDTSTVAFLNTPFFEKYGDTHYTWISYAFMYLENGWVGLFFYFGFFVLVYLAVCKIQKYTGETEKIYCVMARIMAIFCIIISVYNSSLRTEAGYMMYFVLAIPFARARARVGTENK